MGSIKDWIVKKLIMGYLKGLLDKLPLNGLKTVLSVVVVIVGLVLKAYPVGPVYEIAKLVLEFLNTMDIAPVTNPADLTIISGAFGAVTGLIHKYLKKKDSGLPPANTDFGV